MTRRGFATPAGTARAAARRRWPRGALFLLGALLVLPGTLRAQSREPVAVLRVLDGDTVVARRGGRAERVRLLGVDTPERGREGRAGEPYARVATDFVRGLLARAERVELEVAGDRVDAHGRTLGFLWLRLPGRKAPVNLSAELLREGLARAIRFFEYPGKTDFLALEAEARAARRGLWKDLPGVGR